MSITADEQRASKAKRYTRTPEFTSRDAKVLRWIGEQYGARLDVLSVLLGRFGPSRAPLSRWATRDQIERWQRQKLVTKERALGDTWVTLTRQGLWRAGFPKDFPTWRVPVTRVRHVHAVNIVRLWYETTDKAEGSPWVSERMTYQERGKEYTWHVPDGVVKDPDAVNVTGPVPFVGIEVELTHKGRRAYETDVFGNLRSGTVALWYFVPDEQFRDRLASDIEAVRTRQPSTMRYAINILPEVAGTSYMKEW